MTAQAPDWGLGRSRSPTGSSLSPSQAPSCNLRIGALCSGSQATLDAHSCQHHCGGWRTLTGHTSPQMVGSRRSGSESIPGWTPDIREGVAGPGRVPQVTQCKVRGGPMGSSACDMCNVTRCRAALGCARGLIIIPHTCKGEKGLTA